ncbi:unnamed protein product [Wuchereria bancrofti]|uniref:Fibronectin type-III domain-containing protein n=1 Tax=Wuchereria bancrofti TaxID=6293 RepID=A0A3P7EDU9_WUCBA|nr:unnamed protein product [Wuchereria bancrofti]
MKYRGNLDAVQQQNIFVAIIRQFLEYHNNKNATIYPPSNVRVQATSNTSAVVQWDLDNDRNVDGFVIRYIHEPVSGQRDNERWKTITIMNPSARHLHISQLTAHKPYAFCVLAIRQNVSYNKNSNSNFNFKMKI